MSDKRILLCFVVGLICPPTAWATDLLEGVWAKTVAECNDREGPNSRTSFGDGEYHTYERHCKIHKAEIKGKGYEVLELICEEAGLRPEKQTVSLRLMNQGLLKINGRSYIRCRR